MRSDYPQQVPGQPYNTQTPMQSQTASSLKEHKSHLLIPLILVVLLLIGALAFGYWAYAERGEYKNDVDALVAEASQKAVADAQKAKDAEFAEREKTPLKDYKGPGAFGSVVIKYPKTWSAYVTESNQGQSPVDGYFHPNFVPGLESGTAFALHVEVVEEDYDRVLDDFESASQRGEVKVSAIRAKKVGNVTGARIDGAIDRDVRGSVVLFPLRDKTLRLTTESEEYVKDFNNIILANLTFTP